jgi:hypothetical protein
MNYKVILMYIFDAASQETQESKNPKKKLRPTTASSSSEIVNSFAKQYGSHN